MFIDCDAHEPSRTAKTVDSGMVLTVDGNLQFPDNVGTKSLNKININIKSQVITQGSRKPTVIENLEKEEFPDRVIYEHPDELSSLCTIM